MRKRLAIIFSLVLIVALALGVTGCPTTPDDTNGDTNGTVTPPNTITQLSDRINALESRMNAVEGKTGKINNLQSDVTNLQNQYSNLQVRVDNLASSPGTDYSGQINDISSDLDAAEVAATALETRVLAIENASTPSGGPPFSLPGAAIYVALGTGGISIAIEPTQNEVSFYAVFEVVFIPRNDMVVGDTADSLSDVIKSLHAAPPVHCIALFDMAPRFDVWHDINGWHLLSVSFYTPMTTIGTDERQYKTLSHTVNKADWDVFVNMSAATSMEGTFPIW